MVRWMRKMRSRRAKRAIQIYTASHKEVRQENPLSPPTERIDLEHDRWDFIPARTAKNASGRTVKYPAVNTIGTIDEKDLRVIETDDGPRILAAVRLARYDWRTKLIVEIASENK